MASKSDGTEIYFDWKRTRRPSAHIGAHVNFFLQTLLKYVPTAMWHCLCRSLDCAIGNSRAQSVLGIQSPKIGMFPYSFRNVIVMHKNTCICSSGMRHKRRSPNTHYLQPPYNPSLYKPRRLPVHVATLPPKCRPARSACTASAYIACLHATARA